RPQAGAATIDDAGVVQFIRNHDVVLGQDCGNGTGIGGKAALEYDDGFYLLEVGQTPLQLHVNRHGPGDRSNRAGPDPECLERLERPLPEPWMCGEAQIIVRRQVDYRAAVEGGMRFLLVLEDPQP